MWRDIQSTSFLTDGQDKSPYYPLSSQIRLIQLGIEFEELWDLPLYKK